MRHLALAILFSCAGMGGCAKLHRPLGNTEVIVAENVDPAKAQRRFAKALAMLDSGQCSRAEELLCDVLMLDPRHGPARNALGKLYFNQRKYYLASWEFERAALLMPERPEPKNNLGLVLESVGKMDEAVVYYESASALDPENPEYLGNQIRARVRTGEQLDSLRPDIERLCLLDSRPHWVAWAKSLLAFERNQFAESPLELSPAASNQEGVIEILGDAPPETFESTPVLTPVQLEELPPPTHR